MEQREEERLLRLAIARGLLSPGELDTVEAELEQDTQATLPVGPWGGRIQRLLERGAVQREEIETLARECSGETGVASTLSNVSVAAASSSIHGFTDRTDGAVRLREDFTATVLSGQSVPARAESADVPPDWDRYRLLRFLGEGGMGRVWEAEDPRLCRRVAVKFLRGDDPELIARFLQEARTQARVEHDNVCPIYEVGEVAGRPYIAMQFIDGENLAEVGPSLGLDAKVHLIKTVAEALDAAHSLGLVHRDIKPANIMVERTAAGEYKPYLMDFGLARELAAPNLTTTGFVMGTPAYMAPEQARGAVHEVDCRADIYGLGATLFELVVGHPPFTGTTMEVLLAVVERDPPAVRRLRPELPQDLDTVIGKCLQKVPEARYQTAGELAWDLGRLLAGEPIRAVPISTVRRWWRLATRHRTAAALVAAATMVTVLAVGVALRSAWQAHRQEVLGRLFSEETASLEEQIRLIAAKPRHDVRAERGAIAARLQRLEAQAAAAGSSGFGPGNFALGRGFLALGKLTAADDHLRQAWDGGYRPPEVAHALGLTLAERYRQELESAERLASPAAQARRHRELERDFRDPALMYLAQGRSAPVQAPEQVEALIAFLEGRYEAALAKSRAAVTRIPWLYQARQIEGDVHIAIGQAAWEKGERAPALVAFEAARSAYGEAVRMAPSDSLGYGGLCTAWGRSMEILADTGASPREAYEHALATCDEALTVDPDDVTIPPRKARAMLVWSEDQFARGADPAPVLLAVAELTATALKSRPDEVAALTYRGIALRRLALLSAWSGKDPGPQRSEAVACFKRALRLYPRHETAANNLGLVLLEQGQYEMERGQDPRPALRDAVAGFTDAVSLAPGFSLLGNLGVTWWAIGHFENSRGIDPRPALAQAREALNRALAINPQDWSALNNLGLVGLEEAQWLAAAGDDAEAALASAVAALEHSLALNPENGGTYTNLGAVWCQRVLAGHDTVRALAQARQALRKALTNNPQDAEARLVEGEVEMAAAALSQANHGSPEVAWRAGEDALRLALRLKPGYAEAAATLAELYRRRAVAAQGRGREQASPIDAGIVACDQALASNPGLARAHLTRAGLLVLRAGLLSGDRRLALIDEAEDAIRRVVDLDPRLAAEAESLRRQTTSVRSR